MLPEEENKSIYNQDIVDYSLIENMYPYGSPIETIFAPYIKKIFKKNTPILKCKIDKFKRRFGITSNVIDPVSDILKKFPIVLAGGKMIDFITNKKLEESLNDYDIFFTGEDSGELERFLYADKWNNISKIAYLSEYVKDELKVQIINKLHANAEDVIENFDIRACGICTDGDYIYWVKGAIRDSRNKKIIMLNPRGKINGMYRITKYISKGFEISIPDLALISIRFLDNLIEKKDNKNNAIFDRNVIFDRNAEAYNEMLDGFDELDEITI